MFEDLVLFLSNRQLRPFEGFKWPEKLELLNENEQNKKIIDEEWFPQITIMWPAFLKKPISFGEFKPLPW